MTQTVSLVPYGVLHKVLPSVIKFLETSELWTQGRSSVDDIIRFLFTGQMNLWAVHDESDFEVYGYLMTEIKQYPQCSMLVIQYCAGKYGTLSEIGDTVFHTIEQFAKDTGCAGIEFFGRPGWRQHAENHGCTVRTVVYEKHFV